MMNRRAVLAMLRDNQLRLNNLLSVPLLMQQILPKLRLLFQMMRVLLNEFNPAGMIVNTQIILHIIKRLQAVACCCDTLDRSTEQRLVLIHFLADRSQCCLAWWRLLQLYQ